MTNKEIFQELFKVAKLAQSQKGAVAACIVREGNIIISSASSDEPNRHAEDLLFEKVRDQNIELTSDDVLYVSLQPCGARTVGGGGEMYGDCATKVINSPIKNVMYAVPDHHYSLEVNKRFEDAGILSRQVDDEEISVEARKIFNDSMINEEYINQKGDKAFL